MNEIHIFVRVCVQRLRGLGSSPSVRSEHFQRREAVDEGVGVWGRGWERKARTGRLVINSWCDHSAAEKDQNEKLLGL